MSTSVCCWIVHILSGLGSWQYWSLSWMLLLTTNEEWLWAGVGVLRLQRLSLKTAMAVYKISVALPNVSADLSHYACYRWWKFPHCGTVKEILSYLITPCWRSILPGWIHINAYVHQSSIAIYTSTESSRLITILAIATWCLYNYTTGGLSSVLNLAPLFSALATFQKPLGSKKTVFFKLLFHSLLTPFLQAYWHWHQFILLAATV